VNVSEVLMLPSQPQFDVALRGYDRTQVEDYLVAVQRALDGSERRAVEAERRAAALQEQVHPGTHSEAPQPDFTLLGERVTAILRLAEEEAAELVRRGEERAQGMLDEIQGQAESVRTEAANEANALRAEVSGAREEAEAIRAKARQEAEELLQRARWHAEDQAESIVAKAEAEARRVLAEVEHVQRTREEEWTTRRAEHEAAIKALEERHARIVSDLSRLRATLETAPGLVSAVQAPEPPARPAEADGDQARGEDGAAAGQNRPDSAEAGAPQAGRGVS